ncbi:MAG: hypothetical protein KKA10_14900 [Euryarchaeota archaeon]|nr:hypothetical protein [Euryarchaeota archaeon]MCG2737861.1 hypothetical protein [Candidatus Methanoperedenaceae archaeon]
MSVYFKNQLRGYSVVMPTLHVLSKDICGNCIGLEGAKIKVTKGLKKLKIDLENSDLSQGEKDEIIILINNLTQMSQKIPISEETACQKTAGRCKIGPACLALDGALGLMKQITEPVLAAANPEVAFCKTVDVRAACCLDTLATPIKNAMKDMKSGEVFEVIIVQGIKDIFDKFIEREKCTIIDVSEKKEEIHCKIMAK